MFTALDDPERFPEEEEIMGSLLKQGMGSYQTISNNSLWYKMTCTYISYHVAVDYLVLYTCFFEWPHTFLHGWPHTFFIRDPIFFCSGGEPPGDHAWVIPSLSLEGTSSHTWVWGYGFYAEDSDQWCQLQWGARCRVANSRNRTAAKSILFTYVPGAGICNEICMVFKLVV